jgi:hypothetical protein
MATPNSQHRGLKAKGKILITATTTGEYKTCDTADRVDSPRGINVTRM